MRSAEQPAEAIRFMDFASGNQIPNRETHRGRAVARAEDGLPHRGGPRNQNPGVLLFSLKFLGWLTAHSPEAGLRLLAAGNTTEHIAASLKVSPHTVKTHIYNLFRKIHVSNRVQAVHWPNTSTSSDTPG